jgi:pyruvate-formate lyase
MEHGGSKIWAAIDSYFDRGGAQAMISVVGKDDLQGAMERPEEYQDLIVRVGGFSARFISLERDVQQELLDRVTY